MPSKRRKRAFSRRKQTTKKDDNEESDNEHYEIDFIEDYRIIPSEDKIEFLVRWEKYGAEDSTWESFEMFAYDAPQIV